MLGPHLPDQRPVPLSAEREAGASERLETTPSNVSATLIHRLASRASEAAGGSVTIATMAWVYILECNDGTYYVGSTIDLEARLYQHQEGLGAAYTRHRRPVRLAWSVHVDRVDEAFAFEKQIQGWRRDKRQALMEGRVESLPGLASRAKEPPP